MEQQAATRRVRIAVSVLFGVACLAIVTVVVKGLYNWDQQLKAEYATAAVIRETTQLVESHQGQWPKNVF